MGQMSVVGRPAHTGHVHVSSGSQNVEESLGIPAGMQGLWQLLGADYSAKLSSTLFTT